MELFQLYTFIIKPTLAHMGPKYEGATAERLLLGTIAHESKGIHLDQRLSQSDTTLGPAIGIYQIEPATHNDVWDNFLLFRSELGSKIQNLLAGWPDRDTQLAANLSYATAIARTIYFRRPEALPEPDDTEGIWWYYKHWWNSLEGAATMGAWNLAYTDMVEPLFAAKDE